MSRLMPLHLREKFEEQTAARTTFLEEVRRLIECDQLQDAIEACGDFAKDFPVAEPWIIASGIYRKNDSRELSIRCRDLAREVLSGFNPSTQAAIIEDVLNWVRIPGITELL